MYVYTLQPFFKDGIPPSGYYYFIYRNSLFIEVECIQMTEMSGFA